MKKLLGLIICMFAVLTLTGTLVNAAKTENDYFSKSNPALREWSFDGEGAWGDRDGIYSAAGQLQNGNFVYTGAADNTEFMSIKSDELYNGKTLDFTVVVESTDATQFFFTARSGWTNDSTSIFREIGVNIAREDNKITALNTRLGWIGGMDHPEILDKYEILGDNKFQITARIVMPAGGIVAMPFQVCGVDNQVTLKIDSIRVDEVALKSTEYTNWDFEGNTVWNDNTNEGLYTPLQASELNGAYTYTGAASCTGFLWINPIEAFAGKYVKMTVDATIADVKELYFTVRHDYADNSLNSITRETGITATYEDGKLTAANKRVGWLNGSDNPDFYDEYVITGDNSVRITCLALIPAAGYKEIKFECVGVDVNNATVKIDNIRIENLGGEVENSTVYYKEVWDFDYEQYNQGDTPWSDQFVWANNGQLDFEAPLDGDCSLRVMYSDPAAAAWGTQFGGFDTVNEGKALYTKVGQYHIEMDVRYEGAAEWWNIWTQGDDYYAIKVFTQTNEIVTEGKVQNAKLVLKNEELGVYTLSYDVYLSNTNVVHNMNAALGDLVLWFDNLYVYTEDYTPSIKGAQYDLVNTADVELEVALKGNTLTNVQLDDVALDSAKYSYADGKLTLDKSLFAGNDSYKVTVTTAAGNASTNVTKNDNRVKLTGVTVSTISKVYDGNTNVTSNGVIFTLAGVQEGDEVGFTATLAYASKNVGEAINLTVTDATLTGADAAKYVLPETITFTGAITAKEVTITADAISKVYDGTTNVAPTFTVNGLVGEDVVTFTATAQLENKNVGTVNVNLTNGALTGADAANYKLPETIALTATVTKKAVTVTADAKEAKIGEEYTLTYTANGLVTGDTLTGALAVDGDATAAGEYNITVGTLANPNYEISFVGAKLTITEAPKASGCKSSAAIFVVLFAQVSILGFVLRKRH